MYGVGGDGTGCFVIKVRPEAARLTDMSVAGFRQSRYLIRKGVIKNEAKVTSRVCFVKKTGAYFSQLLFAYVSK